MADTVESPLPGDRHGGFGERPGETDQEQSRHRAPGRLDQHDSGLVFPSTIGTPLEPRNVDRVGHAARVCVALGWLRHA
jgi:hypothetical protein